ncbi:hypothetical protein niasHS_000137 [Heterodera schachtii]|uniref:G-protein coupled receptors family 1 profile domain-containing protein n=1 Tax=Heterodera schachtii TaxID=97005 RepID=A0ABD2KN80_HETSC
MPSINTSSQKNSIIEDINLAYRFVGPSADLIVPAVALNLVAFIGIVLNGTVLFVTVKSSSLRGSANFLMAFICLCELIHQIGHTFFLVVVISGTNFVNLRTADLIMTPSIFALNCGIMAMFCAAVDRLFAVISPFNHSAIFIKYKLPYLLGHLFICVIYAALIQYFVLAVALENAEDQTTGYLGDLFRYSSYLFNGCTFVLCFCSIFFYVVIFVFIRCKNGVSQQTNARVLRSMLIILLINIGGYLFTTAMHLFINAFNAKIFESPIRIWQFSFIAGILLNVAAGSNAIVLYFSSVEYRQAFRNKFGALFGCPSQNNTVKIIQIRNLNAGNNKIRPLNANL